MTRKYLALSLILILAITLTACSSRSPAFDPGGNKGSEFPGEPSSAVPSENPQRKVIYEATLQVSVANLDSAIRALADKAGEYGGYVANSNRDNTGEPPRAYLTCRIPQNRYLDFLGFARSLGEPGNESVDSTDITEEFVDLEARLINRRAHEERLLAMLAEAKNVEELLAVERELSRVREDIEVLEGRLRYLGDKVDLAKVTISLRQEYGPTEVPAVKPVGFSETMRRALKAIVKSFTLFLDVLSYFVIILAALLPFAIPALAVLWLAIYLSRRKKKGTQA